MVEGLILRKKKHLNLIVRRTNIGVSKTRDKAMKKKFLQSRTFASNQPKTSLMKKRTKTDIENIRIHREKSERLISSPKSPFLQFHAWNTVHSRRSVRNSPSIRRKEDESAGASDETFMTEKPKYVEVIKQ